MFEAYTVSVKLSLINHVSAGLASISGAFLKTHKDAEKLQAQLKSIKMLGLAGAAVGGAGFMGLGIIGKAIKPAEEYAHQIAQMNVAGMKQVEIVKGINAAWAAAKPVPTSSVVENLAAIRELRPVFRGDTAHAIQYMPVVQKIQAILENTRHGEPGSGKSEAYDVAKALEMKGAVETPEMFVRQANLMTKGIVAMGGKISAIDFHQAFKYGRAATAGWNDEFAYKILPTLIQEMKTRGGSGGGVGGPGNALMSAYAAVVGGTVSQKALKLWNQLGLIDLSKAEWTKVHELKGIRPGGIKGSAEFIANPYEWVQKYLMPSLRAKGYTTEAQQRQALQYLFPNRTAGFAMTQMGLQQWKFEGDKKLIEQASGIDAYNRLLKNDPIMAKMALAKQWENFQVVFIKDVIPDLLTAYRTLREVVIGVTGWMREHSTLVSILAKSFIGLSAAMAIGGTLLVLKAGFAGLGLIVGPLALKAIPGLIAAISGPAGLTVIVGAASAYIGTCIGLIANKLIDAGVEAITGEKGATLGGKLWDWTHDEWGNNRVSKFLNNGYLENGPLVRGANGKAIQVHTQLEIDGHKVAKAVSRHLANEADKPSTGTNMFDNSMSPVPIGY